MTPGVYPWRMATVLVIDADEGMRSIVGMMLARIGHVVLSAPHAIEALNLLQHTPVQLILVETPPDASGAAYAESIRLAHPETPMILLTRRLGDDSDPVDELAREIDATVMRRPFSAEDLTEMTDSLLPTASG